MACSRPSWRAAASPSMRFASCRSGPTPGLLEKHCRTLYSAPASLVEVLANGYDVVQLSSCCFTYPLSAHVALARAQVDSAIVSSSHQPSADAPPPAPSTLSWPSPSPPQGPRGRGAEAGRHHQWHRHAAL
jgi:hypothetical protein